jgi:hypothetical protein
MKEIEIIFFHGYGSTGSTSLTGKMLVEHYGKENVHCLSYNCKNAEDTIDNLSAQVRKIVLNNPEVLLVGISLGGFWANYFSEKYGLQVVLINPALEPTISLKKYNESHASTYKMFPTTLTPGIPKAIILGKKDNVIPYTSYLERLKDKYMVFIDDNMRHTVDNPEPLFRLINYMNNTVLT